MGGPSIIKCSAKRSDARKQVSEWFQRWCAANGIGERDLAMVLVVSSSVARRKLNGESPVTLDDFIAFPLRHRERLFADAKRDLCPLGGTDLFAHG